MARTKPCKACGNTVSKRAAACPKCGEPNKPPLGCPSCCLPVVLFALVAAWSPFIFFSSDSAPPSSHKTRPTSVKSKGSVTKQTDIRDAGLESSALIKAQNFCKKKEAPGNEVVFPKEFFEGSGTANLIGEDTYEVLTWYHVRCDGMPWERVDVKVTVWIKWDETMIGVFDAKIEDHSELKRELLVKRQ